MAPNRARCAGHRPRRRTPARTIAQSRHSDRSSTRTSQPSQQFRPQWSQRATVGWVGWRPHPWCAAVSVARRLRGRITSLYPAGWAMTRRSVGAQGDGSCPPGGEPARHGSNRQGNDDQSGHGHARGRPPGVRGRVGRRVGGWIGAVRPRGDRHRRQHHHQEPATAAGSQPAMCEVPDRAHAISSHQQRRTREGAVGCPAGVLPPRWPWNDVREWPSRHRRRRAGGAADPRVRLSCTPHDECKPPSSSGLGHHPLKVAARVRIPLGVPRDLWRNAG
jgi:hypothetical protein